MYKKLSPKMLKNLAVVSLLTLCFCFPAMSQAGGPGKNWSLKVQGKYFQDDNVTAAPRDASVKPPSLRNGNDDGGSWGVRAAYKHSFNKKLKMGVSYDVNQVNYSNLTAYDTTSQIYGANATYKLKPLLSFNIRYNYIWTNVDGSGFSGSHYISPSLSYMHKTFGLSRIDYTFKRTENWRTRSRDNSQNSFGITQYMFFSKYTRRISLGYRFTNDDTTGSAFQRNIHTLTYGVKTPLAWGVNLNAKGNYSSRDYNSRLVVGSGNERNDDQQIYSVRLDKVLAKKMGWAQDITFAGQYRYLFANSNDRLRNYKCNRFDIGISARF